MMNSLDESIEWRNAGEKMVTIMKQHFDRGSIGIHEYVEKVYPIWKRYNGGERSEDLLTKIQSLPIQKDNNQ